jgi:hypothetical protein
VKKFAVKQQAGEMQRNEVDTNISTSDHYLSFNIEFNCILLQANFDKRDMLQREKAYKREIFSAF